MDKGRAANTKAATVIFSKSATAILPSATHNVLHLAKKQKQQWSALFQQNIQTSKGSVWHFSTLRLALQKAHSVLFKELRSEVSEKISHRFAPSQLFVGKDGKGIVTGCYRVAYPLLLWRKWLSSSSQWQYFWENSLAAVHSKSCRFPPGAVDKSQLSPTHGVSLLKTVKRADFRSRDVRRHKAWSRTWTRIGHFSYFFLPVLNRHGAYMHVLCISMN